jgi:RNA polymerase sigma-70 factor (ECF subfamily)
MECLASLPTEQREVIVLKIWHDLTFERIGELVGVSPNTVAGRYRYGLRRIRTCLEGMTYERLESARLESLGEPASFLEAAPTVPEA